MSGKKKLTIEIDADLYRIAKYKADKKLCMPLATLVRVFLKAFVSQNGIGFFVGDHQLTELINKWVRKRDFERMRNGRVSVITNRLRDIFDLEC